MEAFVSRKLSLIFILIMAVNLSSCKAKVQEPAAAPAGNGYQDTTVGTVVDEVGFNVSLGKDFVGLYDIHKTSSWTAPCTAAAGEDVSCYVDAMELDLYVRGLELRYNVPKNMCNYYVFSPYYYYNLEPGYGAESFSYDVNAAGAVVNKVIGGANAAHSSWNGITPTCNYNYNTPGVNGPNCCLGSYTLTTRTWDPSLNVDPGTGVAAGGYGAPAVATVEWGGRAVNCLKGPAMDSQSKTAGGWPKDTIESVETSGKNASYNIAAPITKEAASNVHVANYSAAVLAAPNTRLSWKKVFQSATNIYPTVQPYYELTCYDRAEEIKSRIRLYVREWNNVAQFDLRTTTGNPDIGGSEATYPNQPINDYFDWADLADGDTFPSEM